MRGSPPPLFARPGSFQRLKPGRDLRSLYYKHFSDVRRERQLFSSLAFFSSFATARAITHAIRAGRGPFGNVSAGGREIHHMTFGIAGLLAVGYLWMLEFGTQPQHRRASRVTSACYGAGAALTLDEFALWLNLEDVYWAKEGRESVDAVVLFGSLLTISVLSRDLLLELTRIFGAKPRARAIMRARRYWLYHPESALRVLAGR